MERLRLLVFLFILILGGVVFYSLTKSWFIYDRGIQVAPIPDKTAQEEDSERDRDQDRKLHDDWPEQSKVHWKNALVYPMGHQTESGGLGPDGIMHHAKNLIVVHFRTGKKRKLFPRPVYIWDYFDADFSKRTGYTPNDEPRMETLSLEGKIIIFASTEDTNSDGFLNHKDAKKVFLYDTVQDRLVSVLPEKYFFDKILWNAGKHRLALSVRKLSIVKPDQGDSKADKKMEKKLEKPNLVFSEPFFFLYDASNLKPNLFEISE